MLFIPHPMYRYIIFGFISIFFLASCSEKPLHVDVPLQDFVIYPMAGTGEVSSSGFVASWTQLALSPFSGATSTWVAPSSWIPDLSCSGAYIIQTDVRGTSMIPLYHDGDMIRYSSGYYYCHDVQRNDIVIYAFPNTDIIKRVVGVPWDTWKYSSGSIFMNGKILKNSEWKPYDITSKMLDLYAHSYPTIPKDTYLILGNQVGGTLDSSKFGLIAKSDIVGKVIVKK